MDDLMPETCADALARWDADEPLWSVAMTTVGPSHEQQIQVMAFECVRFLLERDLPELEDEQWIRQAEQAMAKICASAALSWRFIPSPGQVALAMNLASMTKRMGWRAAIKQAESARRIVVKRTFP